MKFEEALQAMKEGKKVKRKSGFLVFCIDESYFTALKGKTVCYIDEAGLKLPAQFDGRVLLEEDWEIVS